MSLLRRSLPQLQRRVMSFAALASSSPHRPSFKQGKTTYSWRSATIPSPPPPPANGEVGPSPPLPSAIIPVAHGGDNWAWERLSLLGMPRGYPHTCARGFRRYFYMSVGAAFVGNFGTSIATQTLLGGFFAEASPRVWMLKDLAPAIFAAFIANKVISYEGRPKFWLVIYALLTNVSTITDMYIPSMVPAKYLLAAAVVTSMVKQSALLMFFVTRAACLQHFATHNNLAEFTKKFNSFGMVNFTVATALGIAFTSVVPNFHAQLATVMVCCVANTALNYLSVARIAFRVLNPTTAHVVCRSFILSDGTEVMRPADVSRVLGLLGTVSHHVDKEMTEIFQVGPCMSSLDIRADKMADEFVAHPALPFAFGLWEVKRAVRRRGVVSAAHALTSSLRRTIGRLVGRGGERTSLATIRFGSRVRLSLLISAECNNKNLMCAYVIAYAALLEKSTSVRSVDELAAFLRKCCHDHKDWTQRAELLLSRLKEHGWETDSLSLDPAEMRFSMDQLHHQHVGPDDDDIDADGLRGRRNDLKDEDDDDDAVDCPSKPQSPEREVDKRDHGGKRRL